MEETSVPSSWFQRQIERAVENDKVPKRELIGFIFSVIAFIIAVAFFAIHQSRPTGFFKSGFGTAQAVLLYAVIAYSMIPQMVRVITRSRNKARLFEVLSSALFLIAILYFLTTFPFDFAHFKDPLPHALEPLLGWVTDGIAKFFMVLGVVGSAVAIPWQITLYREIKKRL